MLLTQVVTPAGLPGAIFEGYYLIPMLESLGKHYAIRKVVCVADRGLLSEVNLAALEKAGMYYIVDEKLKSLPAALKHKIVDLDRYVSEGSGNKKVLSLSHQSRRIVVNHCERRATKVRSDRDKALMKLKQRLARSKNPKTMLSNYGYKRFIDLNGQSSVEINSNKINDAAKWDGLHGVITNLSEKHEAAEV